MKNFFFLFFVFTSVFSENSSLFPRESEHFIVWHAEADKKSVNDIIELLESSFSTMCEILDISIDRKIEVNVYPNLDQFHASLHRQGPLSDWLVARSEPGGFSIVSPNHPEPMHDYESIVSICKLDLAQALILEYRIETDQPMLPRYILFAMSSYLADYGSFRKNERFKNYFKEKGLPFFSKFSDRRFNEFEKNQGYNFSRAMGEFIVEKYGIKIFSKIIHNEQYMFSKNFGLREKQFRRKFTAYLKKEL